MGKGKKSKGRTMECKKCGEDVENVGRDVKSVLCAECTEKALAKHSKKNAKAKSGKSVEMTAEIKKLLEAKEKANADGNSSLSRKIRKRLRSLGYYSSQQPGYEAFGGKRGGRKAKDEDVEDEDDSEAEEVEEEEEEDEDEE